MIDRDDRIELGGELVVVRSVTETASGYELVVKSASRGLIEVFLRPDEIRAAQVASHDGGGDSARAVTALWAAWMRWAIPRIRSAVSATRPVRPYAHQDDAVFGAMLPQPRLRFLLADEPGTGKTLMTGMYLAEGRRRGLIPGRTVIVVPAHLVQKWIRELDRFFGIQAQRLTPEIGRDPLDLRGDVLIWIVSLDLYTYNADVRRKVVGGRASWSLAVFDEAHRLTPTSQYLGAAAQLAEKAHHLLLLTATPHRGKEHYFRALLHVLDPRLYPWSHGQREYGDQPLRPSQDNFLRRMKEDLRDLEGKPLFPRRFAATRPVALNIDEDEAYHAVMSYVETWYESSAVLARSIYGKRAASSVAAALATLRRRAEALSGALASHAEPVVPPGFDRDGFSGADIDSDEAWQDAEEAVVGIRSTDRRVELGAVKTLIGRLEQIVTGLSAPSKWSEAIRIMAEHGIRPGADGGQLLVFTEFADTARWLTGLFRVAGYSTELLQGDVAPADRDLLQQRFLDGQYQVLVSTDAGGEGIDLQSASVMLDWDIPWSLVRLEQRAGRLHRIGQLRDVFVYHLVAQGTREGRVQEVMLENFARAGEALRGRIYDLLDATAERAGFSFAGALAAAQAGGAAAERAVATVPTVESLVRRAEEIAGEEDRLKASVDTVGALERFARDRLQAINPVIVGAFLEHVVRTSDWDLSPGPTTGIRQLAAPRSLPQGLAEGRECLVAVEGAAVAKARAEEFRRAREVVVLGPTEEPFQALVDYATRTTEGDLLRGASAVDLASLTSYTLFVYAADFDHHDGLQRVRRTVPFLIRYSGAGAFKVAWESVMNLNPTDGTSPVQAPPPAARFEANAAVRAALDRETNDLATGQRALSAKTRESLDDIERRHKRQTRQLAAEARRAALEAFAQVKASRLAQLDSMENVTSSSARLLGWIQVLAGARRGELGYDPDSEKVAVARVAEELEQLGWSVDDRQSARLGYDLFARRPGTTDQRLIEVKGLSGALDAVTLEQHEWVQAQQRGSDYWLFVVIDCASAPRVAVRCQDPAGIFGQGPRTIQRYRIPVSELRRVAREER